MTYFLSRQARSVLRSATRVLLALLLTPPSTLVAGDDGEANEMDVHPPGIDLPEGQGRELLLAACTRCHDLKGLEAYKGYWNLPRWRSMVETMVENGALLDSKQVGIVASYLAEHFGPADQAILPEHASPH